MLQPIAAVLAAAASAGLIVAFVPAGTPDTGIGQAAIDRALSEGNRISTLAIEIASTGTMLREPVEQDLQNSEADHKSACVQSWPYYEPSCLRSRNPHNPRTVRVVVGHAERARR